MTKRLSFAERVAPYLTEAPKGISDALYEKFVSSVNLIKIKDFIEKANVEYERESGSGGIVKEKGVFGINIELDVETKGEINKLVNFLYQLVELAISQIDFEGSDWRNFMDLVEVEEKIAAIGLDNRISDDDNVSESRVIFIDSKMRGISTSKLNRTLYMLRRSIEDFKSNLEHNTSRGSSAKAFSDSLQQLLNIAELVSKTTVW